jgi:hypothetical protein
LFYINSLIGGQIFHDIKNGYTGGSTDLFIPYGENIYQYDINSLYPYSMKIYPRHNFFPSPHPSSQDGPRGKGEPNKIKLRNFISIALGGGEEFSYLYYYHLYAKFRLFIPIYLINLIIGP